MLLVGVQTDPLTVQRSVGENSGSLIGPRRVNGVKMVEGDWSIPRLRRYNCKKNLKIRYTNLHGYGIFYPECLREIFSQILCQTAFASTTI